MTTIGKADIAPFPGPQFYRNLFAENGHSPAEIKARTNTAFAQSFHGDLATEAVCFSAGTNQNSALAYANQYTLAGRPLSADHPTGMVAMNVLAALAASNERAQKFVGKFWNAPMPSGPFRYYDGMLYLMGRLHCGGEFRIWQPK